MEKLSFQYYENDCFTTGFDQVIIRYNVETQTHTLDTVLCFFVHYFLCHCHNHLHQLEFNKKYSFIFVYKYMYFHLIT